MNVVLVHGWGYSPKGHWQQWLLAELKKQGIEASLPTLPNYDHPKQEEWLAALKKEHIDEQTIIIGHSLGVHAILRLLENGKKVKTAILVSGFARYNNLKPIHDFFTVPFKWEIIRTNAKKWVVINSDNDPYIPLELGKELAEKLKVTHVLEHNAGHISISAGFGPYPRVLELVLEELNA